MHDGNEVRAAIRFAMVTTAAAVVFLILVALWASSCDRSTLATAACAQPYRMLLAALAPAVLLCGGLVAFVRTYRLWRDDGIWWGWHGAGWFLLVMMLVVLTMSAAPIIGPAPGG